MLSSVSVWSLCLMYGFTGFSGNFFTGLLPDYLDGKRHLDANARAWLSALPLTAGIFACVLGGWTSDWLIRRSGNRRWGRRAVGLGGLTLAGVTILGTIWVEQTWLLALLLTVSFFGNDLSMGPAWASCADVGERYAGTVSGAMNMIGAFAGAAGAKMAGYLFRIDEVDLVFRIYAGVYWLAALCWLGVDVTKRVSNPS
jgi:MFS family permease